MLWSDMVLAQLTDPFRIGLLVALFATMRRTQGITGQWLPLAAGIAFVAAIIPLTAQRPDAVLWQAIATGVVANCLVMAVILAVWWVYRRLRQ